MATLISEFDENDKTITFEYEEDEETPVWGETITMGDDKDKTLLKVTVGKKISEKSFIATYEVLATRYVARDNG